MERMPTRCRLAWVSLLALVSFAATTSFTKDDAIRMARAGQSEQAILDAIRESHATFDLTANDIAELRQSGATDKVIEAMTEAGPAPAEATQETEEQAQPDQSNSDEGVQEQPLEPEYYPPPPPIAYPVYPLYYPVYYPVYDPFFPFFDGFFFSFGFVHVSHAFAIFPCDRSVVVVNNAIVTGRTWPRGTSRSLTGTTTRVIPRGDPTATATRLSARGSMIRPLSAGAADPRAVSRFPSRASRFTGSASARPAVPNGAPRFQRPAPTGSSPVRPSPRFTSPAPQRPRAAPMPHGGFAPPHGAFRPPQGAFRPSHGGFGPAPRPSFAPSSHGGGFAPGFHGGGFAPRGFGGSRPGGGGGHAHGGHR